MLMITYYYYLLITYFFFFFFTKCLELFEKQWELVLFMSIFKNPKKISGLSLQDWDQILPDNICLFFFKSF